MADSNSTSYSPQDVLKKFLKGQGRTSEEIAKIMAQLEEYDRRGQIDGFFDSIADGTFDVEAMFDEMIEESYEPIGNRVLVRRDCDTGTGVMTGRVVEISAQLDKDRQKYPIRVHDKVLFEASRAIPVGETTERQLFAVPIDDVVIVHQVVKASFDADAMRATV